MSQATISLDLDQGLKRKFDSLCEAFGMTASSALNIFVKTVVRERRIPFEIKAESDEEFRRNAMQAFNSLRKSAIESGLSDMTLDEINDEIKAVRDERKKRDLRRN